MSEEVLNKLNMLIFYNNEMTKHYSCLIAFESFSGGEKGFYKKTIVEMNKIITLENEIYNSLSESDMKEMIYYLSDCKFHIDGKTRIITHLYDLYSRKIYAKMFSLDTDVTNDKLNVISILDSKIDVQSLVLLDSQLEYGELDSRTHNEFFKKWVASKFVLLGRNAYIEDLALKNDFDVFEIKLPSFEEIKGTLSDEAVSFFEKRYIRFCTEELEQLANLTQSKYSNLDKEYAAMNMLANISNRLEFLSLASFYELKKIFDKKYSNSNAIQLKHVKKLLLKKEEEFNN